ncbi:hypothetical protein [Bradyrhizobium canariense]|uniref:hypothetical protein n=1 Tax=Bradyrhizobium canariense TaxID=255045 RepID=UPI000A19526D|nr:hypothetical protein [Bradyrhizobium canariense]OSI28069.1 hypothetical protein BST66_30045 [Bradyrhizobium canariense]
MNDSATSKVRPFLRAVANGITKDNKLRVTLVATPEPSAAADAFEMKNWPSAIASRLHDPKFSRDGRTRFGFALRMRLVDMSSDTPLKDQKWHPADAVAVGHERAGAIPAATQVDRLWQQALQPDGQPRWVDLVSDIRRSLRGKKHKTDATLPDYHPPENTPPNFDSDGALLAKRPAATDCMVVKGILPVKQADYAVDEERVRAGRVLAKMQCGPYSCPADPEINLKDDPNLNTGEAFQKAKQKKLYKDYRATVSFTQQERKTSRDTFKSITEIISGTAADCPNCKADADVIPTADNVCGVVSAKSRATHTYGTWLQREATYKAETIRPAAASPAGEKLGFESSDVELDHVRSIYYALQGDPMLSRLFCLAIDLTVTLPAALSDALKRQPQRSLYLHLDVHPIAEPGGDTGRLTPRVMTAARLVATRSNDLVGNPICEAFWPVSRFEAGVTNGPGEPKRVLDASLVEQRNGVWLVGAGYSEDPAKHAPQYDLISLDIRRAVDGKPDGVDRGQRHSTAGFSVVDRGRARQVARDLAVSAMQVNAMAPRGDGSRATVILHAEELTVGRRVDVAAVKPGTPIDAPVEWRSLMHRFVTFKKLDQQVDNRLRRLLDAGNSPRLLDESSFQVATRFMPMVDKPAQQIGSGPEQINERPHEAITEEAIFAWDGTPSAVATSTGPGNPNTEGKLPFVRAHEPPSSHHGAHLRSMPLRYGVPYILSFRSQFLGCGSPSLAEARAQRAREPKSTLPPAVVRAGGRHGTLLAKVAAPRRFLRHEGISAPQLLLPAQLALKSYGRMGYEQADQAIVRSAVAASAAAAPIATIPMGEAAAPCDAPAAAAAANRAATPPERGPPIVDLAARVRPDETIRVLVAPEASMQTVARHGCLDRDDFAQVMFGGLLDVAYDPAKKQQTTAEAVAGFPMVVTRRAQSLDPDGAIYAREWGSGGKDGIGIPVFQPGPRRRPPNPASPPVGYLPDPAAEEMSIRARIRGTDRYLAGDIAADLYAPEQGIRYPHALPVVVRVMRATGARKLPAATITEIAAKPVLTTFREGAGGASIRVREVKITLHEGEDYDLEVACLPKKKSFACSFSLPETIALQLMRAASDKAACAKLQCLTGPMDLSCYQTPAKQTPLTGLGGHILPDIAPIAQAAADILAAIKTRWPIEEVAAVTRLRVCHAINRPIHPARFVPGTVAVKRPADPQQWDKPDQPGTKNLVLTGKIEVDLEHVDAFEIVATTLGVNGRRVDEPTRGRSVIARRSGRWPKLTVPGGERKFIAPRNVVGFDVAKDGRVDFPSERITLLRVDNLPPRAREGTGEHPLFGKTNGRYTTIDLGVLHAAAIGGGQLPIPIESDVSSAKPLAERMRTIRIVQPSVIADTMARELNLEIVALSRFAETFETAPAYVNHGEPLLQRRQPLPAADQSHPGPSISVLCPASERPAAPEVRRPEPAFVFSRATEVIAIKGAKPADSANEYTVERWARCRIPLGRGWNASEQLGIMLWPDHYFAGGIIDADADKIKQDGREMILTNFEDRDAGPGGAFVTRWGGDPIRKDAVPQAGMFIPPAAFEDWSPACPGRNVARLVDGVLVPLPADAGDASKPAPERAQSLRVSLLTYEPRFDLDREEWYVDIRLAPQSAAEPFVRFGLVRYQGNALVNHALGIDLRASNPVTAWAQLMPDRTLTVLSRKADSGHCDLTVTLKGPGSVGSKDSEIAEALPNMTPKRQSAVDLLTTPAMRVMLVHEAWRGDGHVLRTPIVPGQAPFATVQPKGKAQLKWHYECNLPPRRLGDLGPGSIVVYVEEFDRRMPASYDKEPISPEDMFDPKHFRESGPRFSARVALHDLISGKIAPP